MYMDIPCVPSGHRDNDLTRTPSRDLHFDPKAGYLPNGDRAGLASDDTCRRSCWAPGASKCAVGAIECKPRGGEVPMLTVHSARPNRTTRIHASSTSG